MYWCSASTADVVNFYVNVIPMNDCFIHFPPLSWRRDTLVAAGLVTTQNLVGKKSGAREVF